MATLSSRPASRFRSTIKLALYHSGTVIMVRSSSDKVRLPRLRLCVVRRTPRFTLSLPTNILRNRCYCRALLRSTGEVDTAEPCSCDGVGGVLSCARCLSSSSGNGGRVIVAAARIGDAGIRGTDLERSRGVFSEGLGLYV